MECLQTVYFLPTMHHFFHWLTTSNQVQQPYTMTFGFKQLGFLKEDDF